jgi:hypothetical protein
MQVKKMYVVYLQSFIATAVDGEASGQLYIPTAFSTGSVLALPIE